MTLQFRYWIGTSSIIRKKSKAETKLKNTPDGKVDK